MENDEGEIWWLTRLYTLYEQDEQDEHDEV